MRERAALVERAALERERATLVSEITEAAYTRSDGTPRRRLGERGYHAILDDDGSWDAIDGPPWS